MDHDHLPATFIADAPGLDFLNSIARPTDEPFDWINDGEGLLSWLDQANLVPSETLALVRESAGQTELNDIAAEARALREWFREFVRSRMGKPLPGDVVKELEPLNKLLQGGCTYSQIVSADGEKLDLQTMRHWRSTPTLLLPIGEVLARLVCDEDFSHVKACEGQNCTLLFADHTRRRARRWCSMAVCGNRAKQAAHRHRVKDAH